MGKQYKIEISHRTIIFTAVFVLFLQLVWLIRDLIFSLFIAFIIMSALKPIVNFLYEKKIPRILAVVIVYFLFLGLFVNGLSVIIPPLVKQSAQLLRNLPQIIADLWPRLTDFFNLESLYQYLPGITGQAFNFAVNIFSNALFILTTFFFGFYFLLEESLIKSMTTNFFDEKKAQRASVVFNQIERRLSSWFWGEMVLMFIVGLLNYVGLSLIGIKFALPLAVLAGVLEIVPNLGPTIAAVPAVIIGFSQSTFLGLAAFAVAFIVQQLENSFIVPLVMKKATGLKPIITLVALIIGGRLAGALGVILAIPATLVIETLLFEIIRQK